jgi:C-terminal processing protease CtpA/Prc
MAPESEPGRAEGQQYYLVVGKKRLMLKTVRALLLVLAVFLLGVGTGYTLRDEWQVPWLNLLKGQKNDRVNLTLDRTGYDFSLFWGVWDTLEEKFLDADKLEEQKMIYGAIAGMTSALGDPYTVFLPPSDNQQSKEDLAGEFDGIGVQLGYKKGTLAVMSPLDEHPAIKQGVKAGDLILHLKDETKRIDQDTTGLSLPEAVKLIRGKKGGTDYANFIS